MNFTPFAKEHPENQGFYVLRYKNGTESKVWLGKPNHHFGDVYTYFATYYNNQHDTPLDLGQYVWINSYTTYGPTEWRKMTNEEALEFSKLLYLFGRPSCFHPKGKNPLCDQ